MIWQTYTLLLLLTEKFEEIFKLLECECSMDFQLFANDCANYQ